jgi:hypothetical protein
MVSRAIGFSAFVAGLKPPMGGRLSRLAESPNTRGDRRTDRSSVGSGEAVNGPQGRPWRPVLSGEAGDRRARSFLFRRVFSILPIFSDISKPVFRSHIPVDARTHCHLQEPLFAAGEWP